MILDLFILSIIICFIIDLSGFKYTVIDLFSKITKIHIKDPSAVKLPFISCSLCTIWWSGILYIIFNNAFTLHNLLLVSLFALFSSNISGFLQYIKELLVYIENKLYDILR